MILTKFLQMVLNGIRSRVQIAGAVNVSVFLSNPTIHIIALTTISKVTATLHTHTLYTN